MYCLIVSYIVDPDQMPHVAAFELGLHCLHNNTPKLVCSLKRVNGKQWNVL